MFSVFFPKTGFFVFEADSGAVVLESAASARSIEMLAISCVCVLLYVF